MDQEERRSAENGIWLCSTCHMLVDSDPTTYSPEALRQMRRMAELSADRALGRAAPISGVAQDPRAEAIHRLVEAVSKRFNELSGLAWLTSAEYDARGLPESLDAGAQAFDAAFHTALPYLSEKAAHVVTALKQAMDLAHNKARVRRLPNAQYSVAREEQIAAAWSRLASTYEDYLREMRRELAGDAANTALSPVDKETCALALEKLAEEIEGWGGVLVRFGPTAPEDRNPRLARIGRRVQMLRDCSSMLSRLLGAADADHVQSTLDELEHGILPRLTQLVESYWRNQDSHQIAMGDPVWERIFAGDGGRLRSAAQVLRTCAGRIRVATG
jgi:hypothetical protein